MPLQATSGAASYDAFGGGVPYVPIYIEEVFSTFLYTGNGSTQTITNGIDLAGKGGLVWIKARSVAESNQLVDTVRGNTKYLVSNNTDSEDTITTRVTSFNGNGFSLGSHSIVNGNGNTYASWTFREQPKFFDVVTFTSSASGNKTFSHNLGAVPGCVIIKNTQTADPWLVYHRSVGDNAYLSLNSTAAQDPLTGAFSATSTTFTISSSLMYNSQTYVAYLFAHNAGGFGLTGTDNVISCGSFTTDGSGFVPDVNLGYEPQWILLKQTNSANAWFMFDNMRGWSQTNSQYLYADSSMAEASWNGAAAQYYGVITPTGFKGLVSSGANNGTFIYIAIRRGPMKTPTSGTSVFSPIAVNNAAGTTNTTNFPIDFQWYGNRDGTINNIFTIDRLRGVSSNSSGQQNYLSTSQTRAEVTSGGSIVSRGWNNTGFQTSTAADGANAVYWNLQRAPGFFDVVCYTGTGSNRTVNHNLGVVPEMIIVKARNQGVNYFWTVYTTATGAGDALLLNSSNPSGGWPSAWNNTAPTSSSFTVGESFFTNNNADTYVAYLFASCPGVSKVGSYTGNGSSQTINCGFTGGARFFLVKRTDSYGDWWVYDSARGIVAANDPALRLNSTAAEVTSADAVDTASVGLIVNQESTCNINVNGDPYIYLAIS